VGKRVTILDVAAEAGVSRQTVSRAMNDTEDINAATRRRVLDAAERLGYRPSRFARSFVTRDKTHAVGLVVASFRNPYYTDIAGELLEAATGRGWPLMMMAVQGPTAASMALLSNQVDVLVGHFDQADADLLAIARGLPLIRLEGRGRLPGVHSVEVDIRSGVVEAVRALRERGARRFGMVDSAYSMHSGGAYEPSARSDWFAAAVGEGFTGLVPGEETITGGGEGFRDLMARHPETDAVLMFNDLMALGAVQSAHVLGIDVPGDVRIVGIDGLALGEAVDPPVTSVALDRQGLAANVLDIVEILAAADFARLDPISRVVPSKLLWRKSA
jgi:LacI family transcriptional regulator